MGYSTGGGGAAAAAFSGASVTKTATQSIANGTDTLVTFATAGSDGIEDFDTDAYHDLTTNTGRLVVPSTGKYLIVAHAAFAANATGYRSCFVLKNGAGNPLLSALHMAAPSGFETSVTASGILVLTAADFVTMTVRQNSGGALNLVLATSADQASSFFHIVKVG